MMDRDWFRVRLARMFIALGYTKQQARLGSQQAASILFDGILGPVPEPVPGPDETPAPAPSPAPEAFTHWDGQLGLAYGWTPGEVAPITDKVEAWLGRPLGYIRMFANQWTWDLLAEPWDDNEMAAIGGRPVQHACPLSMWRKPGSNADPVSMWDVARGDYDDYYRDYFQQVLRVSPSGPIYVCLGWEPNFPGGYPHHVLDAKGNLDQDRCEAFKAAFRHVAYLAFGLSNRFCFGLTIGLRGDGQDPRAYYPGRDVVGYLGMNVYLDTAHDSGWLPAAFPNKLSGWTAGWGLTDWKAFADAEGLQFAVPEFGICPDRADYTHELAAWLKANTIFAGHWNTDAAWPGYLLDIPDDATSLAFIGEFGA